MTFPAPILQLSPITISFEIIAPEPIKHFLPIFVFPFIFTAVETIVWSPIETSCSINEKLFIDCRDYYFSNVIARASKTMLDCYNSKLEFRRTGTEG